LREKSRNESPWLEVKEDDSIITVDAMFDFFQGFECLTVNSLREQRNEIAQLQFDDFCQENPHLFSTEPPQLVLVSKKN